jgi:hypothetical protein
MDFPLAHLRVAMAWQAERGGQTLSSKKNVRLQRTLRLNQAAAG